MAGDDFAKGYAGIGGYASPSGIAGSTARTALENSVAKGQSPIDAAFPDEPSGDQRTGIRKVIDYVQAKQEAGIHKNADSRVADRLPPDAFHKPGSR